MTSQLVAGGFVGITSIAYSPARKAAVIAEESGRLTLLDLLRKSEGIYESREIGNGYNKPSHLAIDGASGTVIVADSDGLWSVPLNAADRDVASAFAENPEQVRAMGVHSASGVPPVLVVLDALPAPRFLAYSLGGTPGASVREILPGLTGATDVALCPDNTTAFILATTADGQKLQQANLTDGTVEDFIPPPLPFGGRVAALSTGWALLAGPSGDLAVAGQGVVRHLPEMTPPLPPVTAVTCTDDGRILLAGDGSVFEAALPTGYTDPVLLTVDSTQIFIGGYAPLHIDTSGSGLAFEDLVLSVEDPDLGAVSPSRDETFDPASPHLLLIGGWKSGVGTVQAKRSGSGEIVGRADFMVADIWGDEAQGPAFTVTGSCAGPQRAAAWGGGDAGPQNIDTVKAPAVWRVAIVLVDTTTNLYPDAAGGIDPIKTDWRNAMSAGITVGGVTRSVSAYYSEVSYGKMSMSLAGDTITGPVHTTATWDDLFEVETVPDPANPGSNLPRLWNPKPDTWKSFVSAVEKANAEAAAQIPPAAPIIDFSQVDAVTFVVRTVNLPDSSVSPATATSIGRYVWPQQMTTEVTLNGSSRSLPMVMMPENWTAVDGRQVYETLAHEIGHTLRLPDLYLYSYMNQGLSERRLNDWDLMSRDAGLPGLSLPFRMALGWVGAGELRAHNFALNGGGAVLDTVTLHALDTTPLPPNALRGVEVRIAQGRNYYFEYRNPQGASLGDGSLPMNQVVVGVDVVSPKGGQTYDSRPMVLRLYDDPDSRDDTDTVLKEGAFLGVGDDYREKDFSEGAPKDFVATVLSVRPDSADLQIRYDSEARPELSIRPWPNGEKQWQSPDIEVRNAKSDADPARWRNVPWGGNPNRVVATVRNHGGLEAKDVRAYFSVKNLTTNATDQPPASLEPLGLSAPVTIPAGETRELQVDWVPPQSGHYCLTVDVPLYEDPADPAVHESSDRDNFAQSNYDQFWSESSSPSTRERFFVRLENPTDRTLVVFPRVRQTLPYFRTYLEHSWIRLEAGQSREIAVMTESLDGDPRWQSFVDLGRRKMWAQTNILEISGWVQGVCAPQCTGGATLETHTGRSTTIEDIAFSPEPGAGGTVRSSDGTPADGGTMLMTANHEGEEAGRRLTAAVEVRADGSFFAYHRDLEPGMLVRLSYLGSFGLAPCETDILRADF